MHRKDMFQRSFNLDTVVYTPVLRYADTPIRCTVLLIIVVGVLQYMRTVYVRIDVGLVDIIDS